jgi:hypothetical protein
VTTTNPPPSRPHDDDDELADDAAADDAGAAAAADDVAPDADADDDELDDDVHDDLDDDDDAAPPDFGGAGAAGGDAKRGGFATKMFGDLAKRALMTGIGAVFMSEESLRGQLSEMKLPKEAMHYVVHQADKTKKEIVTAIARETREFLSKLEVDKVLARALIGTTVEIQTRIRVLPKEGGGFETQVEKNDMALTHEKPAEPPAPPKRKRKKS